VNPVIAGSACCGDRPLAPVARKARAASGAGNPWFFPSIRLLVALAFLAPPAVLLSPAASPAADEVTIVLTSDLQGRFSPGIEDQETQDPYLLLGRAILAERARKKNLLYLDLGNAFTPGVLSKFSFGAVVMDYFHSFSCAATLVSSKDLQLGVDSLEALQEGEKTRFVSCNVQRDGNPVFEPYLILPAGGTPLGVIGVSSTRILFDIAEKNLTNFQLETDPARLAGFLEEIRGKGVRHILLLSGRTLEETVGLLQTYPEVGLAVCGGDNTGQIHGVPGTRVDLSDGRSIVLLAESGGTTSLDLLLGDGVQVKSLTRRSLDDLRREAATATTVARDPRYVGFARNLTLWKEKLREEEETILAGTQGKSLSLDGWRLSCLYRDRFNAEVSLVDKGNLNPMVVGNEVRRSEVMDIVNEDFNLYVYKLTGKDLIEVEEKEKGLIVNGIQDKVIQGYPVRDKRKYRVVSNQAVFERVGALLGRAIPFENTWITVTDLILSDLKGNRVVLRDDYRYLDRRFRTTFDFSFSNYFDTSWVNREGEVDVPPGQPKADYEQWGFEDEAEVRFYNNRHLFAFTPYLRYERENEDYQSNLLRGSLLYSYNLHRIFKPYVKSMMETVVERVEGRPLLVRETAGVAAVARRWTANLGFGVEKKVRDPSEAAFYGLEAQGKLEWEIWKRLKYTLTLDSFLAFQSFEGDRQYRRAEIVNGLSVPLISVLELGLKYRWYYYNPPDFEGEYTNSQLLTSLDLKMDTKIW